MIEEYNKCILCPRECNVNRNNNELGFCKMSSTLKVARASLHMWEEPCISGENGSGTVFFSGCNLRCVYCQNYSISTCLDGKEISIDRLSDIFISLQEKNANNINLVTPTHFVPSIVQAIKKAKERGLVIPIIYNTSGYEKVATLKELEGLVDVYLPDMKYFSSNLSYKYSKAKNYHDIAIDAIKEMLRQTGKVEFDQNNLIKKGVIVRHLLLPGYLEESKKIIKELYETFKDDIYISIMNQYTPLSKQLTKFPELNKTVSDDEYNELIDYALVLGIKNAYIQEGATNLESFIPNFDYEGV